MSKTDGGDGHSSIEWIGVEDEITLGRDPGRGITRSRVWAMALVAVVLLGTGAWYLTRPEPKPSVQMSYGGVVISNPAAVVSQLDTQFTAFVHDQHGVVTPRSRCYVNRVSAESSEISLTAYCGPVLFFQGAAPQLYLPFNLIAPRPPDGTLSVASLPSYFRPVAVPSEVTLIRPDRRVPPDGADGLTAPGPPPAPADLFVGLRTAEFPALPSAPSGAFVQGRTTTVQLLSHGFVTTIGAGAETMTPPPSERLLAFGLGRSDGETGDDFADNQSIVRLSIDGGLARPLPEGDDEVRYFPFYVVAVPANVHSVDLIVVDGDVTQRLSVLTGRPGPDNVVILQRDPAERYSATAPVGTADATINDDGRTFTTQLTISFGGGSLGFFSRNGRGHASGLDRALLDVAIYYLSPAIIQPGTTHTYGFPMSEVSLTPKGGRPIHAGADGAFDVPASFTTGTLTISGSAKTEFGYTLTMNQPYTVQISFPA